MEQEMNQMLNQKMNESVVFKLGALMMENAKLEAQLSVVQEENKQLKDELDRLQNDEE